MVNPEAQRRIADFDLPLAESAWFMNKCYANFVQTVILKTALFKFRALKGF